MFENVKDLTGKKFGKLLVIGFDEERTNEEVEIKKKQNKKSYEKYWKCICDCGNKKTVSRTCLNSGMTKSCGCISKENSRNMLLKLTLNKNEYEEMEDYYKAWDTKHKNFFYISKEDYEVVSCYCWSKDTRARTKYWRAGSRIGDGKYIKLHQLIMERIDTDYREKNLIIDHVSNSLGGDKEDDNRRCNLELKTNAENNRNCKNNKNNTSGKKGVTFASDRNKWCARICNNEGKRISKYFQTFDEAVSQRVEWEKQYGYIGE